MLDDTQIKISGLVSQFSVYKQGVQRGEKGHGRTAILLNVNFRKWKLCGVIFSCKSYS